MRKIVYLMLSVPAILGLLVSCLGGDNCPEDTKNVDGACVNLCNEGEAYFNGECRSTGVPTDGDMENSDGDETPPDGDAAPTDGDEDNTDGDDDKTDGDEDQTDGDESESEEEVVIIRTLKEYVRPVIWTSLSKGMVVDKDETLFLTDGLQIYSVSDGEPSIHLTAEDIRTVLEDDYNVQIKSIDVGPDNKLYLLTNLPNTILVTETANQVSVHRDNLSGTPYYGYPGLIGVETADRILLVAYYNDGIYEITEDAVDQLYTSATSQGGTDCDCENFVVSQSGFLWYVPGCIDSPLLGGKTDGSGMGILATEDDFNVDYHWSISGLARDSNGDALVHLEGRIFKVNQNGVFREVLTEPSLEDLADELDIGFHCTSMAVCPSGTIYIAGDDQVVYQVLPGRTNVSAD